MSRELYKFIEDQLDSGKDVKSIHKKLVKKGWDSDQVIDTMDKVIASGLQKQSIIAPIAILTLLVFGLSFVIYDNQGITGYSVYEREDICVLIESGTETYHSGYECCNLISQIPDCKAEHAALFIADQPKSFDYICQDPDSELLLNFALLNSC